MLELTKVIFARSVKCYCIFIDFCKNAKTSTITQH